MCHHGQPECQVGQIIYNWSASWAKSLITRVPFSNHRLPECHLGQILDNKSAVGCRGQWRLQVYVPSWTTRVPGGSNHGQHECQVGQIMDSYCAIFKSWTTRVPVGSNHEQTECQVDCNTIF